MHARLYMRGRVCVGAPMCPSARMCCEVILRELKVLSRFIIYSMEVSGSSNFYVMLFHRQKYTLRRLPWNQRALSSFFCEGGDPNIGYKAISFLFRLATVGRGRMDVS